MATTVTLADNNFLSEDEIKEYVFSDVSSRSDEELDLAYRIANGVCSAIENHPDIDRYIINQEKTEYFDGGDAEIFVSKYPIVSISTVEDDGSTLDAPSSEAAGDGDYDYVSEIGEIYKELGVFTPGRQKVKVTYTAGYGAAESDIPWDIKQAALIWIKQIKDTGVETFSTIITEGEVIRPSSIPAQTEKLLQAY